MIEWMAEQIKKERMYNKRLLDVVMKTEDEQKLKEKLIDLSCEYNSGCCDEIEQKLNGGNVDWKKFWINVENGRDVEREKRDIANAKKKLNDSRLKV